MSKRLLIVLAIGLMASSTALAQGGGGGGGGRRGGGGGGGGGRGGAPSTPSAPKTVAPPDGKPIPVDQVEIVGVLRAVGPEPNQVTIAYDAVDALNWPPGTSPFTIAKTASVEMPPVGAKVRFRMEAHQISQLHPY